MATSTYSAPVGEVFGESTALATTLAFGDILAVRRGLKGLQIWSDDIIKFLTTPRIASVQLFDASTGLYHTRTSAAIDNDTATEVSLGTMTTSDILYVGCVDRFLGLSIGIGATVNAVTATLDVEYWNGDWTDVGSDSDGTNSGSATLAQDGLYTWTLPTDWKSASVGNDVNSWFYIRFSPSATLTAKTGIDTLISINKAADYIRWQATAPQDFNYDEDKVGGLQFLAVAGTPTVYVNHIEYKG